MMNYSRKERPRLFGLCLNINVICDSIIFLIFSKISSTASGSFAKSSRLYSNTTPLAHLCCTATSYMSFDKSFSKYIIIIIIHSADPTLANVASSARIDTTPQPVLPANIQFDHELYNYYLYNHW